MCLLQSSCSVNRTRGYHEERMDGWMDGWMDGRKEVDVAQFKLSPHSLARTGKKKKTCKDNIAHYLWMRFETGNSR